MKLHVAPHGPYLSITAYGDDHVTIDGRRLQRSLLLLPERIDETWGPDRFDALQSGHCADLAQLACDVLLLGTGRRQRFPAPSLLRSIYESGRGIEIMDTAAACRTYNILVAEGRRVAAALIIETTT